MFGGGDVAVNSWRRSAKCGWSGEHTEWWLVTFCCPTPWVHSSSFSRLLFATSSKWLGMSRWQPRKPFLCISSFQSQFAGTNAKKSEALWKVDNCRGHTRVRSSRKCHCWALWRAVPVCGTEDTRPARPIEQACLNGTWQAPQNGPLTWGQFAGWEVRYSRSSRRLPPVLRANCECISCSVSDEVWLHSPFATELQKLIKKYMPCYVCWNISFYILTSEKSNAKALTKQHPAHKKNE